MCLLNLFRKKKPKPIPQTGTGDDMLIVNNLNGFGAGGQTTLAYVNSASSNNSADIVVPSDALEGDIAVLYDAVNNSSAPPPSLVTPSGWTNVVNSTFDNSRYSVHYKKTWVW